MSHGFHATLYQLRQAYCHFRGEPLPDNLPYATAGEGLIRDYGRLRVYAVLKAIGRDMDETAAQAAAKTADPGA